MKELLADLMASKKAMAAMASVLAQLLLRVAGQYNFVLEPATADSVANAILVTASAYLVGQGVADWNKSATALKIEAEKSGAETKQS